MDKSLLESRGIKATDVSIGFVDGYELRIGERATLVRCRGGRAYGVIMVISPSETTELYAGKGVADYAPEPVTVELMDGSRVEACCYNLPGETVAGTNKEYAKLLLEVATKLDLPESYVEQIRQVAS